MFSLVRNNVVSARRRVPVISFVVGPILRILVTERRDFLISGITTTFAFAGIIFIPTNLCAGRIFFVVMFNVVTKCRYIGLCNDNFIAYRAMLAFGFAFFSAGRGNCIINNFRMSECGNLLIGGITTTFAFAGYVCFPTFFGASCGLSVVIFQIVTESIDFCLSLQYLSAL